jgi:hypothetical protein
VEAFGKSRRERLKAQLQDRAGKQSEKEKERCTGALIAVAAGLASKQSRSRSQDGAVEWQDAC